MPVLSRTIAAVTAFADQPEMLVQQFMQAHYDWNERSCRQYGAALDEAGETAALERATAEYTALLADFCPAGLAAQPIAFGQPASHDPQLERVGAITLPEAGRAVVHTCRMSPFASGNPSDFEYELQHQNGRWYLIQLYFVEGEGRFACL